MEKAPFPPIPRLVTHRLLLRPLNISDAPEILQLRSDPKVNEFLDRAGSVTLAEARQFIRKIKTGITQKESFYWAITLKGSETLIGTICLWNFSADGSQAEIGYELNPAHQRQGIMQEALAKVVEYAFGSLKLEAVRALCRADNTRSLRLLERNGFVYLPEPKAGREVALINFK